MNMGCATKALGRARLFLSEKRWVRMKPRTIRFLKKEHTRATRRLSKKLIAEQLN